MLYILVNISVAGKTNAKSRLLEMLKG